MNQQNHYLNGLRDGVPIALGYTAVSFSFGIMAKNYGLSTLQAVVMSLTNVTSAGQFAALPLISISAPWIEMALTQLVINLRYCLMSCSLSQKIIPDAPLWPRLIMAAGITDEIFGVSSQQMPLYPAYTYGAMTAAIPGWILGTFLGTLSGSLLHWRAINALSVALYGMFMAIIIPPAKKNPVLAVIIPLAMALSFIITKVPYLQAISPGFKIILLTFIIAGAAAIFFPIKEEAENA